MPRRLRAGLLATLASLWLLVLAPPAGAQQLIDASKDGGQAFLAFAVMVFLFAGSLFYLDRIRRRRGEPD